MIQKVVKYGIFLIVMLAGLHKGFVFAAAADPTAEVSRALSNNDARLLGLLMDDMITISLKSKVNIYSKSQAQRVMKDFFQSEKNGYFKLQKYGGDPKSQLYYGIGTYKTDAKTFIVYYLLKYNNAEGQYLLKELKID